MVGIGQREWDGELRRAGQSEARLLRKRAFREVHSEVAELRRGHEIRRRRPSFRELRSPRRELCGGRDLHRFEVAVKRDDGLLPVRFELLPARFFIHVLRGHFGLVRGIERRAQRPSGGFDFAQARAFLRSDARETRLRKPLHLRGHARGLGLEFFSRHHLKLRLDVVGAIPLLGDRRRGFLELVLEPRDFRGVPGRRRRAARSVQAAGYRQRGGEGCGRGLRGFPPEVVEDADGRQEHDDRASRHAESSRTGAEPEREDERRDDDERDEQKRRGVAENARDDEL